MKILGIETSCDETAVSIVEASGDSKAPTFSVLGTALYSQVAIHAQYGGVFPVLAKREHTKNIVPLFEQALREAGLYIEVSQTKNEAQNSTKNAAETAQENAKENLALTNAMNLLDREPELRDMLVPLLQRIQKPDIDMIGVTVGPGLEPALWVGINFARALGTYWNIPVMPTNHMEGHIVSPFVSLAKNAKPIEFPVLALLISGGHTELVLLENWATHTVLGRTRDDAVGEAFDKVARVLGLPYPGGPEISRLAETARAQQSSAHHNTAQQNSAAVPNAPTHSHNATPITPSFPLPRPMLHSPDLDFSFSGLKTAVIYTVRDIPELTPEIKMQLALEFENAATDVLVAKTEKALLQTGAATLILGGGVVANTHIRQSFQKLAARHTGLALHIPEKSMATDNAIMIAVASYFDFLNGKPTSLDIRAQGNLDF
jgi:N6-L-threonylcarbamoyladenine synthase